MTRGQCMPPRAELVGGIEHIPLSRANRHQTLAESKRVEPASSREFVNNAFDDKRIERTTHGPPETNRDSHWQRDPFDQPGTQVIGECNGSLDRLRVNGARRQKPALIEDGL